MVDPEAPRFSALALPELRGVDLAEVAAGDAMDAVRLHAQDVAELDWAGTTFRGCEVALVGVRTLGLDRARLLETRLRDPDVTILRSRDSLWRGVEIVGGRLAALELAGATWDGVSVSGTRLGYVNLREASLADVALSGCRVETLDLGGAAARRVSLDGCTVDELLLTRATLRDVDLRGARIARIEGTAHLAGTTISAEQLLDVAPYLAAELGINLG